MSVDQIAAIYLHEAPRLFPRGKGGGLRRLLQAVKEKYRREPVRNFLQELFGTATIKDSLSRLLVTSYDMSAETAFLFRNRPAGEECHADDPNFLLRDVVLATTCAPTYFQPLSLAPLGSGSPQMCLVDGGIFAANPAMCGYVEARKTFPDASRFLILSLGTGTVTHDHLCRKVRRWGYVEWVNPAIGPPLSTAMTIGQSECVDHQLSRMPGVDYFRVNGPVPPGHSLIDDTRPENIAALRSTAAGIIADGGEKLEHFVEMLLKAKG
jgi:predicted acylesterase/phospholipase RssA